MVQLAGFSNSFASGEICEDAWERSELNQHQTGCELALNMIGFPAGPCASRGGFWRRGAPKFANMGRRVFPWRRGSGEGLVLEFGHLYARVWTARGAPVINPATSTIMEFGHGFSEADLQGLRLKQVGDVAFVTSSAGLLNILLRRYSDTNWNVSIYDYRSGPFLAENDDPAKTLTLTDLGGGLWQVDASFAKFTASPSYVGAKLRIRPPGGGPGLRTWAPSTAAAAGDQILSVGRVYSTTAGGTTGNTPPTHENGTVSDGGVDWTFEHDGSATLQIISRTSDTQVTAQQQSTLPVATGTTTPNWSDLAWSSVHGYPTALAAVIEERLAFAGTPERPDIIDFSRTAGFGPAFADFKAGLGTGLVVDDDAARCQVGDNGARIIWMVDCVNLVVGTEDAEWIVAGATLEDPITPDSVKPRRVSSHGSADVMPVILEGPPTVILHAKRGGMELRELTLGRGGEGDTAGRDLSILAQHIFGRGMAEFAWSKADRNLWIRLADGGLACMTYHLEHQVIGVRRQEISGGFVAEGICVSPGPDGRERLTVAGYRIKDAVIQRAHLVLAERREGVFVDAADEYSGAPATVISGLTWLEGETVTALADGSAVENLVVSGGSITLPDPASEVVVGLPMLRRFKSLPFDPAHDGTPTAKKQRPTHCYVVLGCVEAVVRAEAQDEPDVGQVAAYETVLQRRPEDITPVVRRKREKVFLGEGADRDVRILVETFKPYDVVVYALRPGYEAN